jgi:hypothetical protein
MITRYISKDKLNALNNGVTPCAAVLYTEESAKPYMMKNDPKMQLVKVIIMTDEEKSGINL